MKWLFILLMAETIMNYPIDSFADTTVDITGVIVTYGTLADVVVGNYLAYGWIYDRYMQGTMGAIDSTNIVTLANLCPNRDEFIVYKARTLFNILYGSIIAPDDSCNFADSTAWRHSQNSQSHGLSNANAIQYYSLHPNPNNGNIIIVQGVTDSEPVNAEILNATGQSIFKYQLTFDTQTKQIHLSNVASGLYLLLLTDSKGQKFNLRFIVN